MTQEEWEEAKTLILKNLHEIGTTKYGYNDRLSKVFSYKDVWELLCRLKVN